MKKILYEITRDKITDGIEIFVKLDGKVEEVLEELARVNRFYRIAMMTPAYEQGNLRIYAHFCDVQRFSGKVENHFIMECFGGYEI